MSAFDAEIERINHSEALEAEVELINEAPTVSEFIEQQYSLGNMGAVPELPEDYHLIKDGYRSRELR